ncbi:hypothetical protein H4R19_003442 [Coemansia spiralis]|nr:hypothetical protein H4R19_003442 [Coemansia spiralis]
MSPPLETLDVAAPAQSSRSQAPPAVLGFRLFRPSIRGLVRQAAAERGAPSRVCSAVAGSSKGPSRVFDAVLSEIEKRWIRSEKSSRARSSSGSVHMARPQPSPNGIWAGVPPAVVVCIRYLQVLSVVVHSLPREMAELLGQKSHASRLLQAALSQRVPIDLRMAIASLAARWCVVLDDSPSARGHMAAVVDAFYYNTGHGPRLDFLPMVPGDFDRQSGWRYPPMAPGDGQQGYFYTTMPPTRPEPQLEQPPPPRRSQPEVAAPVSQSRRVPQQAVRMSRQPVPEMPDLARIDACAQELQALCGMLVDNLIMLPIDEDPEANEVLNDLVQRITHSCEVAASCSGLLTADHTATKRALAQAAEDASRGLGVYDEHVRSYRDWRDGKWTSLYGRPPPPGHALAGRASGLDVPNGLEIEGNAQAESSKAAAARRVIKPTTTASNSSRNSSPEQQQAGLVRVSTKARGKMAALE